MVTEEIQQKAIVLVDTAEMLDIIDSATLARAGEFLREIKAYRRLVSDAFDGIVEKARAAWQEALAQKKKYEKPAETAERLVKDKIAHYHLLKEREAEEERKRQEAEARKAAEEEALRRAEAAEKAGFEEAVDVILENPPVAVPVVMPKESVPKVAGVAVKEKWSFKIVDANAIPREYLCPDEKKIAAVVRATKGRVKIAGVEIFVEKVVAAR